MDEPTRSFLDNATAGLRDDPELRLDVRAELAGHVEDKVADLRAAGRDDAGCEAEALKAMGDIAEVAGELHGANRPRLALRAKLRFALRALVVPAAVLAAFLSWDSSLPGAWDQLRTMGGGRGIPGVKWSARVISRLNAWRRPSRTPEQTLVLFGDMSRSGLAGMNRTMWEAHPENHVYLGNYISHLVSAYPGAEPHDRICAELALAAQAEPDAPPAASKEQELGVLKQQAETMEQQMKQLRERVEQLEVED